MGWNTWSNYPAGRVASPTIIARSKIPSTTHPDDNAISPVTAAASASPSAFAKACLLRRRMREQSIHEAIQAGTSQHRRGSLIALHRNSVPDSVPAAAISVTSPTFEHLEERGLLRPSHPLSAKSEVLAVSTPTRSRARKTARGFVGRAARGRQTRGSAFGFVVLGGLRGEPLLRIGCNERSACLLTRSPHGMAADALGLLSGRPATTLPAASHATPARPCEPRASLMKRSHVTVQGSRRCRSWRRAGHRATAWSALAKSPSTQL